MVSGSVSSPFRGAFHLSLTVLVHYRSLKLFSLGGWAPQLPTRLHVPRGTQDANPGQPDYLYGSLTRCAAPFQALRVASLPRCGWSYNPAATVVAAVWALPASLATTTGISFDFSWSSYGDVSVRPPPPAGLCVQPAVSSHHAGGVAPFGYSGLLARMQLPLNVSPVSASFIGLQRRGIRLVLSLACATRLPCHANSIARMCAQALDPSSASTSS